MLEAPRGGEPGSDALASCVQCVRAHGLRLSSARAAVGAFHAGQELRPPAWLREAGAVPGTRRPPRQRVSPTAAGCAAAPGPALQGWRVGAFQKFLTALWCSSQGLDPVGEHPGHHRERAPAAREAQHGLEAGL